MPIENQTPNRLYPLPHVSNELQLDVARIIAALTGIDIDVASLLTALLGKANADHDHVIADVTGLISALAAKQDQTARGIANGYASLGSDGKVPTEQLPAALFGALNWQGTWNANTNTPTIPAAAPANKGHYYKVATAGTTSVGGFNDWQVGDWVVSNGTSWDKIDNTDQVVSVAGQVGVISAAALKTALAINLIDNTSDANKPVSTAQQTALNLKANQSAIIGRQTLAIGAGDWVPDLASGPSVEIVRLGANGQSLLTLDFDPNVAEYAHYLWTPDKKWDRGSLSFEVLWTGSAAGSGGVLWQLVGASFGDGEALDQAMTNYNVSADTYLGAWLDHKSPESNTFAVSGSPAVGDAVWLRLVRLPADPSDTLAQDAKLIGIRVFYMVTTGNDA